jgi:hypothetical protein
MIGFSNSGEHHRARPLDAKATLSLARDDIINGRALLAPTEPSDYPHLVIAVSETNLKGSEA